MDLHEIIRHILRMYEPKELKEALTEAIERHIAPDQERLASLRSILTDPVNQLEVTKGGYYIYRFDLETMHRIADAVGIPKAEEAPTLHSYTPDELARLILP